MQSPEEMDLEINLKTREKELEDLVQYMIRIKSLIIDMQVEERNLRDKVKEYRIRADSICTIRENLSEILDDHIQNDTYSQNRT